MADRTIEWDSSLPGFGIVTMAATGHESFVYQWRDLHGSHRMKLTGRFIQYEIEREKKAGIVCKLKPVPAGTFTRKVAKLEAEVIRGAVGRGRNPLHELRLAESIANNTFKTVADAYFARPDVQKLRSADQQQKTLDRLVIGGKPNSASYAKLGNRPIDDIKRTDIRNLLATIAKDRGPVMADRTGACLSAIFNWWITQSDDFQSPMVRGLKFSDADERRRDRLLNDDEIRAIWKTAEVWKAAWRETETPGKAVFGSLVQFLLLTGSRRDEAAKMKRAEIDADGNWICPAARHKSKKDFLVPLSNKAREIADKASEHIKDGFVFTSDAKRALGGYSKFKADFDKASGTSDWTIHDLRHTARTLLTRAGVSEEHAERAIAHAQRGIVKTYNHWQYRDEKAEALRKLAGQIELILNPPKGNVLNFPQASA